MKKTISGFLLVILMVIPMILPGFSAQAAVRDGDFTWIDYPDGTAVLQSYTGSAEEVTVPAEHNGYRVTAIAPFAFYSPVSGSIPIRKIILSEGIEAIAQYAFYGCPGLREIELPDSLKTVEQLAFMQCPRLKSVRLGPRLESVSKHAFEETNNNYDPNAEKKKTEEERTLEKPEVFVDPGLLTLRDDSFAFDPELYAELHPEEVRGEQFMTLGTTLVKCNSQAADLVIPEGIEAVLDIPSTATRVTFGPDVKYVAASLSNVSEIRGGENITCIDMQYYSLSSGLKNATNRGDFLIIGSVLVRYNGTAAHVTVPDGVTMIGDEAFVANKTIETVELPGTVKRIGYWAFTDCTALKEINIPASVEAITGNPFTHCGAPEGLTVRSENERFRTVDDFLYDMEKRRVIAGLNPSAEEIRIPEGTAEIGADAFRSRINLKEVTFPEGLARIESGAFRNSGLREAVLPDSLYLLGDYSFRNCRNLGSVDLGRGVTGILYHFPFDECDNLTKAVVRPNVKKLRMYALGGKKDKQTVYGVYDTTAEYYAIDSQRAFVPLEEEPAETVQEPIQEPTPEQADTVPEPNDTATAGSIPANTEGTPGLAWSAAGYSNGGYYLVSDQAEGEGSGTEYQGTIRAQLFLESSDICFRCNDPEGNSLFRNPGDRARNCTVLLITGSSEYVKVLTGVILPGDVFCYLSDEPLSGQDGTVYDLIVNEIRAGGSLDFWANVPLWNGTAIREDGYETVHWCMGTDAEQFAALYDSAVNDNWGFSDGGYAPVSAFDTEDQGWEIRTEVTGDGSYEYLYYLTDGVAVSREALPEKYLVEVLDSRDSIRFRLWNFSGTEFVPISPVEGEGFSLNTGIAFTGQPYAGTYGFMQGGTGLISLYNAETNTDISPAMLAEFLTDGNLDGVMTLNIRNGQGETAEYSVYFKLPMFRSNFRARYQEIISRGWGVQSAPASDGTLSAPGGEISESAPTAAPAVSPTPLPAGETSSDDPAGWNWIKTHFDNGTMYICNRGFWPGSREADGREAETAYMKLYEYYGGFFVQLFDGDGRPMVNPGSGGGTLDGLIDLAPGRRDGRRVYVNASPVPGSPRINFKASDTGFIQNALGRRGRAELTLTLADGSRCRFTIPDSDYQKMLDMVSDDWSIPTFNDRLYTGTGVNPDLEDFFKTFYPAFERVFETARNTDARFKSGEMRKLIGQDAELTRMFNLYDIMNRYPPRRRADEDCFLSYKDKIDRIIAGQDIRDGLEYGSQLTGQAKNWSSLFHRIFGDDAGNDYDLTLEIMDGFFETAGYLVP